MSGHESNYASWFAKAEHDLLNIQNNLAAVQIPWDTVCFHAQQAAEKCLEGFPHLPWATSLQNPRSGGSSRLMR
jgi:HEPN domain